jgi:hypothetical protein
MIKTILIVTLIATGGQPPATYREEFDRPIDCKRAAGKALDVYSKAYGYGIYEKGLNFIVPTPTVGRVQIQIDCVEPEKGPLQSN